MTTHYQSHYHIRQMDCPCEEQMIRMALAPLPEIENLTFDLAQRTLVISHTAPDATPYTQCLEGLNLGSQWLRTETADAYTATPPKATTFEHKVLITVLLINLAFFFVEWGMGIWAHSMGLEADGLDMLADALVYGMALIAVGASVRRKQWVAWTAGGLQILLAVVGLAEVVYRFLFASPTPHVGTMIAVSLMALIGNAVCLVLLQRSRSSEVHMRASIIFSANDVIANLGVVASALMVLMLESRVPDLVIGGVVFALVLRGALRIFRLARSKQSK